MANNAKDAKGEITGEITPEEIEADKKANANQDTKPSIAVETGLRALRQHGGKHRK